MDPRVVTLTGPFLANRGHGPNGRQPWRDYEGRRGHRRRRSGGALPVAV